MDKTIYERFDFIDGNGRALDDYHNEFRDEQGEVVIVPREDWHLFVQIMGD